MAQQVRTVFTTSIRVVCDNFYISETCYHDQAKLSDENAEIADWFLRLTTAHKPWGFGLCFLYLRNIKGYEWNHKRVYRIYKELELNLRIKPRRRIKRDKPAALSVPDVINQVWSMDFMSDSLTDGHHFRTFNVLDDYNRECLGIDVDLSLLSSRVIRSLEQIIEWRGKPLVIRCDNSPEYISQKLKDWTIKNRLRYCTFNLVSQLKMLILNASIEHHAMSGWIYIYLNPLNKRNYSPRNGFGNTIMNDRIHRLRNTTKTVIESGLTSTFNFRY